MRHLKFIPIVLTMLLAWSATEAHADMRGRVTDADTGLPVVGANVTVAGTAAITDEGGRFRLSVDSVDASVAASVDQDSLTVSHVAYEALRIGVTDAGEILLQRSTARLQEVIVRAGWTDESLQRSTSSVSVLSAASLRERRHLQDVTANIPNLNWAGGTSRPQYFQIRGIGERSNYAGEGAPSFSVGTVVDDIDLSGLGTGGALFDLEQVEIYRGPQSTIFGANAMAGLIHMRSADPVDHVDHGFSVGAGSDGLLDAAGYVNLPVRTTLAVRGGYSQGESDGFRDNEFLKRDNTNRRRESVARLKGLWTPTAGARVTATAFHAISNNGYDAWAPDNNEALRTYSDNPGVDEQRTTALSVRAELPIMSHTRLLSISAFSRTKGDYSFDSDWGNDSYWRQAPRGFDPDVEGYRYDFFDDLNRDRQTWTQELRLVQESLPIIGGRGVVGVFARGLQEDTDARGFLFGGDAGDLESTFDVDEIAFYTQHQRSLTQRLQLSATARADRNQTTYRGDTDGGAESVGFETSAWLAGGRVGLSYTVDESSTAFLSLARGYRAGGINQHPRLADNNRPYESEYVLNTELGYRWSSRRARASLTAFHGRRSSQQVKLSTQQDAGDPNSFVYFTNNSGAGWNAGVELDGSYAMPSLAGLSGVGLSAALGILQTQVDEYTFFASNGQSLTLGDRASAHAPSYNLSMGIHTTNPAGPQASLELTAMDAFFFSDSHDQKSNAYSLWNGSIGYRSTGWSLRIWGRNLLDKRYAVRGFYFGLEPPAFADTLYVSYGDPRQVGVTLTAHFADLVAGR